MKKTIPLLSIFLVTSLLLSNPLFAQNNIKEKSTPSQITAELDILKRKAEKDLIDLDNAVAKFKNTITKNDEEGCEKTFIECQRNYVNWYLKNEEKLRALSNIEVTAKEKWSKIQKMTAYVNPTQNSTQNANQIKVTLEEIAKYIAYYNKISATFDGSPENFNKDIEDPARNTSGINELQLKDSLSLFKKDLNDYTSTDIFTTSVILNKKDEGKYGSYSLALKITTQIAESEIALVFPLINAKGELAKDIHVNTEDLWAQFATKNQKLDGYSIDALSRYYEFISVLPKTCNNPVMFDQNIHRFSDSTRHLYLTPKEIKKEFAKLKISSFNNGGVLFYFKILEAEEGEKTKEIQITETTQEQWYSFKKSNPSTHKTADKCMKNHRPKEGMCPDLPVETISASMVKGFLRDINDKDTQCTYRLPTNREWTKLAETTTNTPDLSKLAWTKENSPTRECMDDHGAKYTCGYPSPVASRQPDETGLYDIIGNVYEMMANKAIRGGSFFQSRDNPDIESANVNRQLHGRASQVVGFRMIRECKNESEGES